MTGWTTVLLASALLSCGGEGRSDVEITSQAWQGLSQAQKQEALDKLAGSCSLPVNTLGVLGESAITLQPPTDANYTSVDCLLTKLKPMGNFTKLGFTGNEAVQEDR